MTERTYPVTELEMRQIQQDCAYPSLGTCDGCPLTDETDESRASGLGCNFIGANNLIDEIIDRPRTYHISDDELKEYALLKASESVAQDEKMSVVYKLADEIIKTICER